MKHAIKILESELDDVKADRERYERLRRSTPAKMRPSEWAMTIGSLKTKELELFEAIQVLGKVGTHDE